MSARTSAFAAVTTCLPLAALLGCAALPLLFLVGRLGTAPTVDVVSLRSTLTFVAVGAAIAAGVGGALGAVMATREMAGRLFAIIVIAALLAAPPAFWWIGVIRLAVGFATPTGPVGGSIVVGVMMAPITVMLVLAAAREIPSVAYEAARVSLRPVPRLRYVLLPMLRPALTAGFLLTAILLLGESEIPFLFGFRTSMTDVVTIFSQTFDAGRTVPLILPLLAAVLLLAALAARPLFAIIMATPVAGQGVVRKPAGVSVGLVVFALPVIAVLSLSGYLWSAVSSPAWWPRLPLDGRVLTVSIAEPVVCALASVALVVLAAYPARRSAALRPLTIAGLVLFCVPAAVSAIVWIPLGQAFGFSIPPAAAYVSRTIGLPALGFLTAYSRLPRSLEDAGQLVRLSPFHRAWTLVLPLLAPSLAATAALTTALIFADRDVASLLLAPGESRLMLNLYLLSANAPSASIGAFALVVFAAGAAAVAVAGGTPLLLLRRRG